MKEKRKGGLKSIDLLIQGNRKGYDSENKKGVFDIYIYILVFVNEEADAI